MAEYGADTLIPIEGVVGVGEADAEAEAYSGPSKMLRTGSRIPLREAFPIRDLSRGF